jgi:diadenosine tetraphosphate (Ap4A) HIT family hydrolase
MFKRFLYSLVALSCFVGGFYFYAWKNLAPSSDKGDCAFCNAMILNHQKFYEDELVLALYTHKPILPGHCLVIPKRHVERFDMLTDEEMLQIGRVIKKVDQAVAQVFQTSSYFLLQKNDLEVQSVPHLHVHYIPRKAGDNSMLKIFLKMFTANIQKPISKTEMEEVVEKMKRALITPGHVTEPLSLP